MKQYLKAIMQLSSPVKLFFITNMTYGLGIGIWNVNLNFHLKTIGLGDLGIGKILAFGAILTAVLSLIAGSLSDKIGYHPSTMYGCIVRGSGMVLIALAHSPIFAYIGLFIASLGDSFVYTVDFPYLFSLVREKERNMTYSLLVSTYVLAMFVGNYIGGYLPGMAKGMDDTYLVATLIGGFLIILTGLLRSKLPKVKAAFKSEKISLKYVKDKKIIIFLLYSILFALGGSIMSSMMNIVYRDSFHLGSKAIGQIYSITNFAMFSSAFFVPLIIKRWKSSKIALTAMIALIPLLVFMSVSSVSILIILIIIYSFLVIVFPGTVDSPMLQTIAEENRGLYSGFKIFASFLGSGIGASLAGAILEYTSYPYLFISSAFVILIVLLVYYFGCRRYLP